MLDNFLLKPVWQQQLILIVLNLLIAALLYFLFIAAHVERRQINFIQYQQININIQQLKRQIGQFPSYQTLLSLNTLFPQPQLHNQLLTVIHSSNSQLLSLKQVKTYHWQLNCLGNYHQVRQLLQQLSQTISPLIIDKIDIAADEMSSSLTVKLDIYLKE